MSHRRPAQWNASGTESSPACAACALVSAVLVLFGVACGSGDEPPSPAGPGAGAGGSGAAGGAAAAGGTGVAGAAGGTGGAQAVGGAGAGGTPNPVGGGGGASAGASGSAGHPDAPMWIGRRRVEYQPNPLGIDVSEPRLDWILHSDLRGQRQSAYEVLVASTPELLAENVGDLWTTGKVLSNQSTQLPYEGTPLGSRQRAWWKVRAYDQNDQASPWSEPAWWEAGLLEPSDWQASWIAAAPRDLERPGVSWIWYPEGSPAVEAPAGDRWFRKTFDLPGAVRGAFCRITADNEYELFVNGTRVGGDATWQDVGTYSVASLLVPGSDVIAVRATNTDGPAGLVATLDVVTESGEVVTLQSDASWKAANAAAGGWETASFDDAAWAAAQPLGAYGMGPWGPAGGNLPAHLRTGFTVAQPVAQARLYVTALGLYEAWLNGERVGADYLTPGWTDYRRRVQVQTYDVTDQIIEGDNAVGAILADGWYSGKVGYLGYGDWFGQGPNRLLLQLEVIHPDGTRTTVVSTDDPAAAWKSSTGPILSADLLNGEIYDARLELDGWASAGFDDSTWDAVRGHDDGSDRALVADVTPGVRVSEELVPQSVAEISPGVFIYDLGQNMVGWARLRVEGSAGSTLVLRFAEVLNPDGTLYTANLRGARATDEYTLRGQGEEIYEPRFTTHGFRYVELSGDVAGLVAAPDLETITGIVAHSYLPSTGTFETSSGAINQLQSNIVWGQRGNFVSVPTDCPQRDERLGWSGDAQVFVRTATYNMDVASFYTKWMFDMVDAQESNGAFADVAPNPFTPAGTPAWGDAGVIVPFAVYLAYADTRILEQNYPAMKAWVEYIRAANPGHLWQNSRGSDYGDWLSINADTDKELLATAFYAHSTDLLARAARRLGNDADADSYQALFENIRDAFNSAYVNADGTLLGDTQTAYALALRFDLLPEEQRAAAATHLADDVRERGHLSTGFVGVAHLLPSLTGTGHVDLAYQLLNTETFPSWLYAVNLGATTIWERWDGIRPDGSFQTPTMNSFNHYSFGAVGEWMYATIAGIELDEDAPGYQHFYLRPQPGGGITSARGALDTMYGRIVSEWSVAGGTFTLNATVPVNTTASVHLPYAGEVLESGTPVTPAADGAIEVGSGQYVFTVAAP